jgi:hypothetical protein
MHVRAMRALEVSDPSRGSPVPSQSRRKVYVEEELLGCTIAEVEIQIPLLCLFWVV